MPKAADPQRVKVKPAQWYSSQEAKKPRPPRVPLALNRRELRALLCLIGRVKLTRIERLDLIEAVPEMQRALTVAASGTIAQAPPCHDTQNRVMTRTMAKATKKKPNPVKRSRGVPVQFYLSDGESSDLRAIARKRKLSIADLVRTWIRKARPKRKRVAKPDPRQRALFDAGPGSAAHA